MCGIYGSIGFAPDQSRIDIVAHRGPDGRGWQEFSSPAGPVALGHRRLAIIDISDAGLQPMADPSGRYQLVFNGELYNYLELREELRGRGEVFQTETDSEVLLRAYMVWGEAALDRFRGMFAFLSGTRPSSACSPHATVSASSRSIWSPTRRAWPSLRKSSSYSACRDCSVA